MKEKERETALESLKRLRRKGTITDDVAELASYREEKYLTDGKLTEPSDGKRFEWRKMIDEVKKLGRPLTEDEAEKFRVK